jgi:tRNA-specific 2-thiouridylase
METQETKTDNSQTLVAVAMSGGVDSSVAALLVKRAGYRAVGITMKLWSPPVNPACDTDKTCCTVDSALDAKRVCDQIGIPHFTLDMQEDFQEKVIQPFQDAYLAGETPNPCVNCNSFVKWDALWKRARAVGADVLATGHYAMTEAHEGRTYILRGGDAGKDQSYFLWGVPPDTLARTLFPLAHLTKPQVRALAAEAGLRTAQKGESQDICFIPNGDYRAFVREKAARDGAAIAPGVIRGPQGEELGRHEGLPFYTIGQRKGIGVAASEPLYVKKLERDTNTLVLGRKEDLNCESFRADRVNLFEPLVDGRECLVQYRYRSPVRPAVLRDEGNGWITVTMKEPGFCVSPGQSAVFYDGNRLIGGARIRETF